MTSRRLEIGSECRRARRENGFTQDASAEPRVSRFKRGIDRRNLHFALAVAAHVTDEAAHYFLSVYNPSVRAIRQRLPFLPLPTFTFPIWIAGLAAGILLLLVLSPLAFHGSHALAVVALPLALIVGVGNALGHIVSSIYLRRAMPGVLSAPFLLLAAIVLFAVALPLHGIQ